MSGWTRLAATLTKAPWCSIDPCRKSFASSASTWLARVGLTNGSRASTALHLGCRSSSSDASISSGKSSATVRSRVAETPVHPIPWLTQHQLSACRVVPEIQPVVNRASLSACFFGDQLSRAATVDTADHNIDAVQARSGAEMVRCSVPIHVPEEIETGCEDHAFECPISAEWPPDAVCRRKPGRHPLRSRPVRPNGPGRASLDASTGDQRLLRCRFRGSRPQAPVLGGEATRPECSASRLTFDPQTAAASPARPSGTAPGILACCRRASAILRQESTRETR
jgi:hypothetical protein